MLTLTAPLLAARSMLPLSERMRLEHFGDSIPPANSRYRNAPSKRQLAPCTGNCLTEENTRPIRLRVDYASLDPETAPPYAGGRPLSEAAAALTRSTTLEEFSSE